MNAIILCGGLSTRLGDITKSVPKILLEIKGKTVLDWQIDKLKKAGIDRVILAAGHLSEVLKREVGGERGGVKIVYAIEKEKLGTGGAIKFAWSHAEDQDKPVIILNGDVLTTVDLAQMAARLRPESEGMILGAKVPDASNYGTLFFDDVNRLKEFREKEGKNQPAHINGGIYLFNSTAKKHFPESAAFSIEYDVFPKMTDLDVHPSDEPWVDIGVPERLKWARENWPETE